MEKNIPLLEATLGAILASPAEHEQSEWRCETGMCFAGHAAMQSGVRWFNKDEVDDPYVEVDGDAVHVASYAAQVLGLTASERMYLFDGTNTVGDIEQMVKNLANGRAINDGYNQWHHTLTD